MDHQEFTYRVLAAGYALLHVPDADVLHHGFRDWRSGGPLIRRTYVAIGAAYAKHIGRGDAVGALLLLGEISMAVMTIVRRLAGRHGPFGFGRLVALLRGA